MALPDLALPFGIRDIKLKPLDSLGENPGTAVDLPAARTLSFKETEDFEELRGDDVLIASHGAGPVTEWELEGGGISLLAYVVIAGGANVLTGVTPNQKRTFTKLRTDARPYFQPEGQAISDSGGDVHAVLYRCKADGDLEGEFANGGFFLTQCAGKGYGSAVSNKLYDFVHNETAVAIT
jgi:hypothetical protein